MSMSDQYNEHNRLSCTHPTSKSHDNKWLKRTIINVVFPWGYNFPVSHGHQFLRKILLVLLLLLLLVLTSQQFLIISTILLTSIKPSKWGFVLVRLHKAMIGQFRGQLYWLLLLLVSTQVEQWLHSSFVAEVNHRQRAFLGLFIIVDQHEGMRRTRLVVILHSKLENENGATPTIAPSLHSPSQSIWWWQT